MRVLVPVVCAIVVAAAGCGSGGSGSAAPPQTPSTDPGGGATTAEPSPAPPSSQPSPSPEPAPSPSPAQPQPQPDRFVDVERLDANAECDGLVPERVPAPVTVSATGSGPGPGSCGRGISEGTGHVAAVIGGQRGTEWLVFGPEGRAEQRFVLTSDLWPQPEGWQGLQASTSGVPAAATLLSFFADGSPRRSEQPQPGAFSARVVSVAPDPRGGSAVVLWGPTGGGDCQGELRRFDAAGAPRGTPSQVGCNVSGLAVSTSGEALVLEAQLGGGAVVRWVRPDGTAPVNAAADPFAGGPLVPLLDGSLVLKQGPAYVRRWAHLATASEPAPAWLGARTGQTFRFTRGNKGYAFFPPPGQQRADCTQVVELVAPSGRRCAKLTFRRDGNACVTGAIDQGWDGTVVQQVSSGACGWRFWPGLLSGG